MKVINDDDDDDDDDDDENFPLRNNELTYIFFRTLSWTDLQRTCEPN